MECEMRVELASRRLDGVAAGGNLSGDFVGGGRRREA